MAINKFQAEICEFLKALHRGENDAIHSRELEEWFNISGRELRYAINRLRSDGYPICSSDAGYFYANTQDEIERTIRRLNANVSAMSRARNGRLYATLLFEEPVRVKVRLKVGGERHVVSAGCAN